MPHPKARKRARSRKKTVQNCRKRKKPLERAGNQFSRKSFPGARSKKREEQRGNRKKTAKGVRKRGRVEGGRGSAL